MFSCLLAVVVPNLNDRQLRCSNFILAEIYLNKFYSVLYSSNKHANSKFQIWRRTSIIYQEVLNINNLITLSRNI